MESAGDVLVIVLCDVLWAILHFDGGEEEVFIKAQHVLVSAGEVLVIVLCNVIFTAF